MPKRNAAPKPADVTDLPTEPPGELLKAVAKRRGAVEGPETRPDRVHAASLALTDLGELLTHVSATHPKASALIADAQSRLTHIRPLLGV